MHKGSGLKVQVAVPLVDSNGEPFDLRIWSWWQDEVRRLMDVLPNSQGPWTTRTERFRWLAWLIIEERQLDVLIDFFERTRQKFGLAELYFDHHPVTFGIATDTS